jgi:hypothetical protein
MQTLFVPHTTTEDATWEALWAPYDQPTYQAVVDLLTPADIVLEIGAGDLRLAIQIANAAQRVYAIEIQEKILDVALNSLSEPLPGNLVVIHGDACRLPFPSAVTTAVLLMRHCTHFQLYAEKLKRAGCQRLVTNARWRMSVEVVMLQEPKAPFENVPMGWYACWCGAVGFKPGAAGLYTLDQEAVVHQVAGCPQCHPVGDVDHNRE